MSGDQLDLDAIEARARHWDHLIRDDPDTTLALVAEVRRLRAVEARVAALADAWNCTPDFTPSNYDSGRVDQRHHMTEELLGALDPM